MQTPDLGAPNRIACTVPRTGFATIAWPARIRTWYRVLLAVLIPLAACDTAWPQIRAMPASVPSQTASQAPVPPYSQESLPVTPSMVPPGNPAGMPPQIDMGVWTWQLMPEGLIYRSYIAAPREPRFASRWIHERDKGWLWDAALGGRVGLLRYGTLDTLWPEGFQLDFAGAAFPRLDLENDRDVVSTDFRVGIPLTFRRGRLEAKLGYVHLSSHLGDEYWLRYPGRTRRNYVRDSFVLGLGVRPNEDVRLYAEADWAFYEDDGAKPWEFQFGVEYAPGQPTPATGAPFFAVNSRLREDVDFSGNFTLQTGWMWRGRTGYALRAGLQYFNGMLDLGQFHDEHEEQVGIGVWYDF